MISTRHADDAARAINERNAKTSHRAEAAAGVIVAVVMAVLGAAALAHFLAPCAVEGSLCVMAALRTRRNPWQRLYRALQAWHLNMRIRSAEREEEHFTSMAELAPEMAELARNYAATLRVQLANVEGR